MTKKDGLTTKQALAVADMVSDIAQGKGINPTKSCRKIYKPNNPNSASVQASRMLSNVKVRQALLRGLKNAGVIGENSKVERRLKQGLDAVKKTTQGNQPAYTTRLKYIKEINKVSGMYAPEKKQVQSMNINFTPNTKDLQKKIRELEEELKQ